MHRWPNIPYGEWSKTCAALHLYCQIVGKYRLAHTPWAIHSWHATLYPTARGLTSGLVPDPAVPTTVEFDFIADRVRVSAAGGAISDVPLRQMSVATFYDEFREALRQVGASPQIHGSPNEIPEPTPFRQDEAPRPWQGEAVRRWHSALLLVTDVFERYRTGFLGKSSPVHLFWGSFDLAVTRFSGRPAPKHPGGIPALPDPITVEAYSHEVMSAGFWPGGGGAEEAMFYAYAYPTPAGFDTAPIAPEAARWDASLGEFLLPYEALRRARDPAGDLLAFLEGAYEAAANAAGWDREALDAPIAVPLVPRAVDR